jgi:putative phage-type endonuclease
METQQRTNEWFQARRGKLTASNLGSLLGFVKWCSRQEAYDRVLGVEPPKADTFGNRACDWGTTHERDGVLAYMTKTGNFVSMTGLHVHKDIPWIAGSPDGFVGSEGMIEVKCPYWQKKDGSPRLHTQVPLCYYLQMNALLEITEREWCDYVCWVPNEGTAVFRVYRDRETFDYLMNHYSVIYAAVANGMRTVPALTRAERDRIEARVQAAMHSKVDLFFWTANILTSPPEREDSEEVTDEDEVPPTKRLCLSETHATGESSHVVATCASKTVRSERCDDSLTSAAETLLALRDA